MELTYINLIFVMLISGIVSFGGGIGGVSFLYTIVSNYRWLEDEAELIRATSFSWFGGFNQSLAFAAYVGSKLGAAGAILAALVYSLPTLIILILVIKLGLTFYKNKLFIYSLKYTNLIYISFIMGLASVYVLHIGGVDPLFCTAIVGLAALARIRYRINAVLLLLIGGILGAVLRL